MARDWTKPLASLLAGVHQFALRLLLVGLLDAFAIWFLFQLAVDGIWFLFSLVGLVTTGINVIFLRRRLYPFRWLSPVLVLLVLMVVYPLAYNIYVAFTNYSHHHLLTKEQAIHFLESQQYLPEGEGTGKWAAYRNGDGDLAVCIRTELGELLLFRLIEPSASIDTRGLDTGVLDEEGLPSFIDGFDVITRADTVRLLRELSDVEFGFAPSTFRITSLDVAGQYRQRYSYDASIDAMIDHETGRVYYPIEGTFTSVDQETLRPAFHVSVGLQNFDRLVNSPALQGPLLRVFVWTVGFALLAVVTTFILGLGLAIAFNDDTLPARKLVRSVLLIPYAIPYFISILMWRGMLNPHTGVISRGLEGLVGWSPPWLSDQWWTRVAIVFFVNLWLGFPYMMLVVTGGLQAIPSELYEAAEVDGASGWQKFSRITLPLLLVAVGPLLVFSFAFNFNNFNVIYLFNEGGPPMPNAATPVGHTDILITYSYRLAFEGTRGGDYGLAASITILIFLVLAVITLVQFRYARIWEEISENA